MAVPRWCWRVPDCTLLIVLALEPGRVVSTARLIDGVWGDNPPTGAVNALQVLVSRLRRVLPEASLESHPTGYRLVVEPDAVDVTRFEHLVTAGRSALAEDASTAARVLAALGLREQALIGRVSADGPVDRLSAALRGRSALLVLDNCEHMIGAVAALADRLLGECPQLRILATSREPLGIIGEALWPVELLALPPEALLPEEGSVTEAMSYAAVRLLGDRARAVRFGFALTEATVPAVVRICRALDGLPLAIELAAARLRTMTAEQLASQLDDRFRLLTGGSRLALPRHRTLRAVVDWSWDLLSNQERTLLRRWRCSLEARQWRQRSECARMARTAQTRLSKYSTCSPR